MNSNKESMSMALDQLDEMAQESSPYREPDEPVDTHDFEIKSMVCKPFAK